MFDCNQLAARASECKAVPTVGKNNIRARRYPNTFKAPGEVLPEMRKTSSNSLMLCIVYAFGQLFGEDVCSTSAADIGQPDFHLLYGIHIRSFLLPSKQEDHCRNNREQQSKNKPRSFKNKPRRKIYRLHIGHDSHRFKGLLDIFQPYLFK